MSVVAFISYPLAFAFAAVEYVINAALFDQYKTSVKDAFGRNKFILLDTCLARLRISGLHVVWSV